MACHLPSCNALTLKLERGDDLWESQIYAKEPYCVLEYNCTQQSSFLDPDCDPTRFWLCESNEVFLTVMTVEGAVIGSGTLSFAIDREPGQPTMQNVPIFSEENAFLGFIQVSVQLDMEEAESAEFAPNSLDCSVYAPMESPRGQSSDCSQASGMPSAPPWQEETDTNSYPASASASASASPPAPPASQSPAMAAPLTLPPLDEEAVKQVRSQGWRSQWRKHWAGRQLFAPIEERQVMYLYASLKVNHAKQIAVGGGVPAALSRRKILEFQKKRDDLTIALTGAGYPLPTDQDQILFARLFAPSE